MKSTIQYALRYSWVFSTSLVITNKYIALEIKNRYN